MIVIKVQKHVEKLKGEKLISDWVTDSVTLSVTPDSITMKQWSDFWLTRATLPEWFKEIEGMTANQIDTLTEGFDEAKISEYMQCIATLVSCFCDKPNLIKSLPFSSESDNSIVALYSKIIHAVYTYEPKTRESFEHKGVKFVFPKSTTDTFGREWVGAELSTGESIEALQAAHVLNAKNEFGEYILNDRKYHTDIALLAALARKVNQDGTIEVAPIETMEQRKFYDERILFFKDVPMSIALDMSFFLSSSKLRYVSIPTYQLLTSLFPPRLMRSQEKKPMPTSGRPGGGR